MKTYYVATLARWALVEAEDEEQARQRGHAALHEVYADVRERLGREAPINILVVRPATDDEVQMWDWHHAKLESEKKQ